MQGLNVKEVCRQIKAAGRSYLIWWRKDEHHFVTNRHWLIKIHESAMPREILIQLFSIFAKFPEGDSCLMMALKSISEPQHPKVDSIFASVKDATPGKVTKFIEECGGNMPALRIIQHNDQFIRASEEYIRMVDYRKEVPLCTGKHTPLFFLGGAVLILPVRQHDTEDRQKVDHLMNSIMADTMVLAAATIE